MSANGFAVTFEDGRTETVYPRLGDTLQYSFIWKKRQWPSPQEDQILLSVFTAYAACRREGKFTGTFEEFQNQVVDFAEVDADGNDVSDLDEDPAPMAAPAGGMMPGFDMQPPGPMSPQEPGPIVEASHSTSSSSTLTTIPEAGSSRHSR